MRPLTETDPDGRERLRKNIYFTNYTLSINSDLDTIKFVSIVDSKIKKIKNQNALSFGNNIRKMLHSVASSGQNLDDSSSEDYDETDDESEAMKSMGFNSNLADDTYLSMYFGKNFFFYLR